jgi:hypothetical protein
MTRRQLTAAQIFGAILTLAWYLAGFASAGSVAISLPEQLNDRDFWKLSQELSEANGYFRSDNLLSNEIYLQYVIPELVDKTGKPGRVYLGVGPEQNFTYIAALKPAMAFIVDVRRGNLHMHLMYKALFEMSADRAEFVSRLFSRKRPAGLTKSSTAMEIFTAFTEVPASEALQKQNLAAIQEHLTKKRGTPLSDEDLKGIEYITQQFYWYGPGITYNSSQGRGGRMMSTYFDLMVATDAEGKNRSFLANEENFNVLKTLHSKNLLVPVVGNFGGPKALRAVGKWVREQGAIVAAFYLSNVEQYLNQDGLWPSFCHNVATLPLDDNSVFIRSVRGGNGFNSYGFGGLTNVLGPMRAETKQCPGGARP